MVELANQPLLTLAGMFVLGNSRKGRKFTGGASGKSLMIGGFAASGANALGDQVNKLGGGQLGDELAQVLAGAGLSWAGKMADVDTFTNPAARGIMYNAAQQSFNSAGVGLGDMITDTFNGSGGTAAPSVTVNRSPSRNGNMTAGSTKVY